MRYSGWIGVGNCGRLPPKYFRSSVGMRSDRDSRHYLRYRTKRSLIMWVEFSLT
ncbi:hypothetical protein J6590_058834 [Homalodisca vitripennis]|nr:hypothetical protein J6590_058834 [Homalodisca vitripennis]